MYPKEKSNESHASSLQAQSQAQKLQLIAQQQSHFLKEASEQTAKQFDEINSRDRVTKNRSLRTTKQYSQKVASKYEKHEHQNKPKRQQYCKFFMFLSILFGFLIVIVYFESKGSNESLELNKFLTTQNAGVQKNQNSIPAQEVFIRKIFFMLQSLKNKQAYKQTYFSNEERQLKKIRKYPYQAKIDSFDKAILKKQQNYYLSMPEMQIETMQLLKQKLHKTYNITAVAKKTLYKQKRYKTRAKIKNRKQKRLSGNSFKSLIQPKCSSKYVINYIWVGIHIPVQYQNLAIKCKDKIRMINETQINRYMKQWNDMHETKIKVSLLTVMYKVNLGKLLFLYFESGIYADFDTEIDETCFNNVQSDKMIFANLNFLDSQRENMMLPQQNFMYVQEKYNKQVERQILRIISGQGEWRWNQCRSSQCLILMCQNHLRDNTHRRGYGNKNQ